MPHGETGLPIDTAAARERAGRLAELEAILAEEHRRRMPIATPDEDR